MTVAMSIGSTDVGTALPNSTTVAEQNDIAMAQNIQTKSHSINNNTNYLNRNNHIIFSRMQILNRFSNVK